MRGPLGATVSADENRCGANAAAVTKAFTSLALARTVPRFTRELQQPDVMRIEIPFRDAQIIAA